jgi:hypothetical protein
MTKFKVLGAAAILSMLVATPTLAEPMNQEPGLYSFYHPNSDPNLGSAAPADAMALDLSGGNRVMMKMKLRRYPARARR